MKHLFKHTILIGIILLFSLASVIAEENGEYGAIAARSREELTLQEMLIYSLQDEYLARAEYELIMENYGTMRPFSNIMQAEERHIERLLELFDAYGYNVPEDDSKNFVVLPENLKSSFETGVQAEIDNIAMYDLFLNQDPSDQPLPEDIIEVFESLKRGSENHLRAFRNNLNRYE